MASQQDTVERQLTPDEDIVAIQKEFTHAERIGTYGTVQSRHVTGEIIKVPRPSSDPNDPLNWSQGYKWYIAVLVCLAMVACNFLAAGPTIQIVETTLDFFPDAMETGLTPAISKVAYFFTSTALCQGLGQFFWIPLMNKYGRRPIYLTSFALYFVTAIGAAFTKSYTRFLVARIIIGFAAGAAEGIAPVTISDVFFLHERGMVMACYTMSLNLGVAGGIIIDGLISIHQPWRVDYYLAIALVGALWVLIFFTFPETAFIRVYDDAEVTQVTPTIGEKPDYEHASNAETEPATTKTKASYGQRLKVFSGTYTSESLLAMMFRPWLLILLPTVLWAALVMSVTIGFLVAITSNVASAFQTTYGFAAWQSGLCFISALIGSLLGILFGGKLTDVVADWFTRRNGGIREPEMRLPAIAMSVISAPLALALYGCSITYSWHWMVPTVALGLLNFSIVQATNVSVLYTIDSYRPIAGEVMVTQLAFKSAFGFLLSFYTNPWAADEGYSTAFGIMAAICASVLLFTIPLYFFGKKIRLLSARWRIMKLVVWNVDRDTEIML